MIQNAMIQKPINFQQVVAVLLNSQDRVGMVRVGVCRDPRVGKAPDHKHITFQVC